jgi:hypothetical protein
MAISLALPLCIATLLGSTVAQRTTGSAAQPSAFAGGSSGGPGSSTSNFGLPALCDASLNVTPNIVSRHCRSVEKETKRSKTDNPSIFRQEKLAL